MYNHTASLWLQTESVIKGNFLVLKLVHLIRSGTVDLNRRYFRLMDQLFLKIISHKN